MTPRRSKKTPKPKLPLSDLKTIVEGPETFSIPLEYREAAFKGILKYFRGRLKGLLECPDFIDIDIEDIRRILSDLEAFLKLTTESHNDEMEIE